MNNLVYVTCDGDWCGLYVNGRLFAQGHSLHVGIIGEVIHEHGTVDLYSSLLVDDDWMNEQGYLPDELKSIPSGAIVG